MGLLKIVFKSLVRAWSYLVYRIQRFILATSSYDTVVMRLRGRIVEAPPMAYPRLLRRKARGTPLLHILGLLEQMARDEKVKRVIVRIAPCSMGWAQTQAVARALSHLGQAGKETIAFFERGGTREIYLAAHCQRVCAPPSTTVHLTGVLLETVYLKELLDKLEVQPELFAMGKYKSAAETFTRKSPSPASGEVFTELIQGLFDQLVAGLAQARNLKGPAAKRLVDGGPYTAQEAHQNGLIDDLFYWEELLKSLNKNGERPKRVKAQRYLRAWKNLQMHHARYLDNGSVALVFVQGTIVDGKGDKSAGTPSNEILCRDLRAIAKNDRIKAVVVRVASPGGSALASDLIWMSARLLKKKKPLIVSMGDVAASGGYYISMAGDEVFVEEGTLTGSIGVITGKFNFGGLYHKLGISKKRYSQGKNAGIFSDNQAFTGSEKQRIRAIMERYYRLFVEKVAQSRNLEVEHVEQIAQGRVYLGRRAVELGLADKIGGLTEALACAREKIDLASDAPLQLVIYPRPVSPLRQLLSGNLQARLPEPLSRITEELDQFAEFQGEPQFRLPFLLRFR